MKPEAQRIAIAQACGITIRQEQDGSGLWSAEGPRWSSYKTGLSLEHAQRVSLPDYLNSLDEMHEAEKVLMKPGLAEWCDYTRHLRRICGIALYAEIHATAAQRAEAFLRTLNLWTE